MDVAQGSYRNLAEVSEVVRRVKQLVDDWPEVWGTCNPTEVCVVAPYHYQVNKS